jgi:hypothetical protein
MSSFFFLGLVMAQASVGLRADWANKKGGPKSARGDLMAGR